MSDQRDRNYTFFDQNADYEKNVRELDTYARIRKGIEAELIGCTSLLDVGNGGFFNYSISHIPHVHILDLFLNERGDYGENVSVTQGSVLDCAHLSFPRKFDVILLQMLIHHVTGRTVPESLANLRKIFDQLSPLLTNQGKLVVVESTIPTWFFSLETLVFERLNRMWRFPHPLTLQYTTKHIEDAARESGFHTASLETISKGRWVLQFGVPVPSAITPVSPVKIVLVR